MAIHGFIVKVLFICIASTSICCPSCSAIATSPNEMPTHLISVDYSSYPYADNNNPSYDTSGQESIKIENRQLYDTVKHASGYDPDANTNSSRSANNDETNEKVNSSTVKIFVPPRKSAVIQAIPRKVRGPGTISTTTSSPFARPPTLHAVAKDYGTGEPTTTIVYATSIPTTPSRTYVNIRPVPLLSTQKYRSTVVESKPEKQHEADNTKPVVEKFTEDQDQEQQQQQQQQQAPKSHVNVLEKPTFKIESNSEQASTTPRSYETTPYHIEQRKRNLYKSVPYARIRTNEDIDEMPAYNRNAYVNPYPNHKWTNDDYMQSQMPQLMYENHQNHQQNYYQPSSTNQNIFSSRYPSPDEYQDEMYRGLPTPSPIYIPHQQPIASILSQQQQQQQQQQRQQYQPLTVRDFDLLLQLLVLRERRLHASQEPPYPSAGDYNAGIQQDNNYYYDMPKTSLPDNQFYKNREPKYIESSIPRSGQPPNTRLLPSNVREELLFRMLLLALHLQPQSQPKPMPPIARNPPILPPQYMYLGSPPSAPSTASSFHGFRQRNGIPKNPVRSVQVLGEID